MDRDSGVGHPGESGVAQAVSTKVFVTQVVDDVVPVGGVAEDGSADSATAWSGEQACVRSCFCFGDAALDEVTHLGDERDLAGTFSLGGFVGDPARGGSGLATDGPPPIAGVDVADAASRDFPDAGRRAGGKDGDVAPPLVTVAGSGDQCVG